MSEIKEKISVLFVCMGIILLRLVYQMLTSIWHNSGYKLELEV